MTCVALIREDPGCSHCPRASLYRNKHKKALSTRNDIRRCSTQPPTYLLVVKWEDLAMVLQLEILSKWTNSAEYPLHWVGLYLFVCRSLTWWDSFFNLFPFVACTYMSQAAVEDFWGALAFTNHQETAGLQEFIFMYLFWVALGLHCSVWAFSSWGKRGLLFSWGARVSHCSGFSCWRAQAWEPRPSSCGILLLRSMWNLPGPGIKPMSPTLAGRLSITGPQGKSKIYRCRPPSVPQNASLLPPLPPMFLEHFLRTLLLSGILSLIKDLNI